MAVALLLTTPAGAQTNEVRLARPLWVPDLPGIPVETLRSPVALTIEERKYLRQKFAQAELHYELKRFDALHALLEQLKQRFPESADPYVFQARVKLDDGQFEQAVPLAATALLLDPNHAWAARYLAHAYQQLGRLPEALSAWEEAVLIDPGDLLAHQELGLLAFEMGHKERAVGHFLHILEARPNDARMHHNAGVAFYDLKEIDRAIEHHRRAIQLDPDLVAAHNDLGSALFVRGDVQEAIAAFRAALAVDSRYAAAYGNLGGALVQAGEFGEAVEVLCRLLETQPRHKQGWSNLLYALQKELGENAAPDDARQRGGREHLEAAHAARAAGQEAVASWHLVKALTAQPAQPDHFVGVARAFEEEQRQQLASVCLRAALELDPEHAAAKAAHKKLRYGPVVAELRQRVEEQPEDRPARERLAELLLELERWEEAANEFMQLGDLPRVAEAQRRGGDLAGALRNLKRQVAQQADDWSSRLELAQLVLQQPLPLARDVEMSIGLLREACEGTGHADPRFLAALAEALALVGRSDEALQAAHETLRAAGGDAPAFRQRLDAIFPAEAPEP